jgi:hypothetical protein
VIAGGVVPCGGADGEVTVIRTAEELEEEMELEDMGGEGDGDLLDELP